MAALHGRGGLAALLALLLLVGGEATTPRNCLRLRPGSTAACAACTTGYYVNWAGFCRRCSNRLPGCSECDAAGTTCTLCRAGHRLSGRRCTPCADPSCLFCRADAARCEECAEGFYATAAGQCRLCEGCAGPCRADGTCSTTCPSGFGMVRGKCRQCASLRCANCDGNRRVCSRCLPHRYGLSGGRCARCPLAGCDECEEGLAACRTCAFRWVRTASGGCRECATGCLEGHCQPDGTCTKCRPGWGLIKGKCSECRVVGVGDDSTVRNNRCLNCDGNIFRCKQCDLQWGMLDGDGACYECFEDPSGRYGPFGQCEYCDGDLERCSRCTAGTYLAPAAGKCLLCSQAIPNCRSCRDARTCTDCWTGHALVGARCVACPPGCEDCGADPARCLRCNSFYALDRVGGRCVPL